MAVSDGVTEVIVSDGSLTLVVTEHDGSQWVDKESYDTLTAQRDRLIQALTPSGDAKRVYMGEVRDDVITTVQGEDGEWEEVNLRPYVSWTAIKDVMKMIRKEAGL